MTVKDSGKDFSGQGGNGRYLFLLSSPHRLLAAQFDGLSQPEQEAVVTSQGVYIAVRQEPEFIIHLYQLENFYVEVFYHQLSKNPVCLRSFTHVNRLDAYVNGMDLGFGSG